MGILGVEIQAPKRIDDLGAQHAGALLQVGRVLSLTKLAQYPIQIAQHFGIAHDGQVLFHQGHAVQSALGYLHPLVGLLDQHAADDAEGHEKQNADQAELHAVTQTVHQCYGRGHQTIHACFSLTPGRPLGETDPARALLPAHFLF